MDASLSINQPLDLDSLRIAMYIYATVHSQL
ncbi:hypothetical protein GA0116948_11822 [Chitinophaga costaii]|uniref:Uncharacterized protein n=1 Tax=Chitinophaga costaii TaxID=1335309 RepID=A0A1C4FXF5_9BACT|nr:hypothetical protein GA0116948_11822 [Chitinophaga costaii]